MSYDENELIPISALSQYYYCPRRAALLLLEQEWTDNIHTIQGNIVHQRVHQGETEIRPDLVRLRAVPLHSLRIGLFGIADSVEFYAMPRGFAIKGLTGLWEVIPVEYKHGKVRKELEYEVQLCGQAICLEEMLSCVVRRGYIYYAKDHRRHEVILTKSLRSLVAEGTMEIRKILQVGEIPPVDKGKRCSECSMQSKCMPKSKASAANYIKKMWDVLQKGDD